MDFILLEVANTKFRTANYLGGIGNAFWTNNASRRKTWNVPTVLKLPSNRWQLAMFQISSATIHFHPAPTYNRARTCVWRGLLIWNNFHLALGIPWVQERKRPTQKTNPYVDSHLDRTNANVRTTLPQRAVLDRLVKQIAFALTAKLSKRCWKWVRSTLRDVRAENCMTKTSKLRNYWTVSNQ